MESLFEKAASNVNNYKNEFDKNQETNLNDAKEYFFEHVTKDVEEKIKVASEKGKTQLVLIRINFNHDNKMNWPEYYHKNINIKDILFGMYDNNENNNNHNRDINDSEFVNRIRKHFNCVKDGEKGFKVSLIHTSRAVWCLFIYWRDLWEQNLDIDDDNTNVSNDNTRDNTRDNNRDNTRDNTRGNGKNNKEYYYPTRNIRKNEDRNDSRNRNRNKN
jgi:hypothetical protein